MDLKGAVIDLMPGHSQRVRQRRHRSAEPPLPHTRRHQVCARKALQGPHRHLYWSINDLLKRCAAVNPDFSKVDVSEIECRGGKGNPSEYCLAVAQVTNCFEAASEVKRLIHSIS